MFQGIFECTTKERTAALRVGEFILSSLEAEPILLLPPQFFSDCDLCKVSTRCHVAVFSVSSPNCYTCLRVCSTESNFYPFSLFSVCGLAQTALNTSGRKTDIVMSSGDSLSHIDVESVDGVRDGNRQPGAV